jgi:hypothetical protein
LPMACPLRSNTLLRSKYLPLDCRLDRTCRAHAGPVSRSDSHTATSSDRADRDRHGSALFRGRVIAGSGATIDSQALIAQASEERSS